ncbi:MAG: FAD-dependent oxidoreductase [Limnothrix sp.]
MKRRDFIKLSQLMLVSSLITTSCQSNASQTSAQKSQSILIIGAGLAGLTAAQTLTKQGYKVQVLEARNRLGGRTWTSNYWADAPLDLGASWIHGIEENPLTQLANDIDTPLVRTRYDNAIAYSQTGQPLTEVETQTLQQLEQKFFEAIAAAQNADTDQSLQSLLEQAMAWEAQPLETQQLIDFLTNSSIEHEYGGSLSELSTHWFDDAVTYPGNDAIFVEGYQAIINHLAQDIPIKLNQIVETIDWSANSPKVSTKTQTYTADQVIITLPLGVLKSEQVEFIPALPTPKREAIKALGMGVLNKCYLRFSKVFWSEQVDWIEQVATERGLWTEWVNLFPVTQLPILLGFNAAAKGREIEKWTDETIVDSAMKTLQRLFGKGIPQPIDYQITRWQTDPFARGAYSFNALGSTPDMRDRLAEPLNNQLFFAGEATERSHFATAHGAYLSGLRVAQEIADM